MIKLEENYRPFVFVLMPFSNEFKDIYKFGIKAACNDEGAICQRVDEQFFDGTILERIYDQIEKADLIISDMTNKNPNVFYETGYAHGIGKNVILLTQIVEDIPFDLKHYNHIIYKGEIDFLQNTLSKRLAWEINKIKEQYEPNIEIFINGKNLSENVIIRHLKDEYSEDLSFKISILNHSSFSTKNPFKVCLESPVEYSINNNRRVKIIMRNNKCFHQSEFIDCIYPKCDELVEMKIGKEKADSTAKTLDQYIEFTFHLYTKNNHIKIPFTIYHYYYEDEL